MANTLTSVAVYQITSSFTTAYTVPSSTTFTVAMIHLVNTSSNAVQIQICLVPNGGSASAANALLWNYSIAGQDILEFGKGDLWPALSTLQVNAGTTNVVNIKIAGIQTA